MKAYNAPAPARIQAMPPADTPGADKADIVAFLGQFSIETTPRENARLWSYREHLEVGTSVSIVFVPGTDISDVIKTAGRLRCDGLNPVPHLAARSIVGRHQLNEFLACLSGEAGVDEVLVIGGSIGTPVGEFHCSMDLLNTGLFDRHGIRRIGVAGHPEGNSAIGDVGLRRTLSKKNEYAKRTDAEVHLVTQFCFEAAQIIEWDMALHAQGNRLPIHVGIPGLATLKTLLNFARLCGVGSSVRALKGRAGAFAKLTTSEAPDALITALARYCATDPDCGIRQAHFYPFGGLAQTSRWAYAVRDGNFVLHPDRSGFAVNDQPASLS